MKLKTVTAALTLFLSATIFASDFSLPKKCFKRPQALRSCSEAITKNSKGCYTCKGEVTEDRNVQVDTSDAAVLVRMLTSDQGKSELRGKNIKIITFTKETISTTWNYKARIRTTEDGLGLNGVDTHPCFTNISITSVGGTPDTTFFNAEGSTVCTMNNPKF